MNVCMYVCMHVQNVRVCHGVSYRFWAKMWHPEDPPPTSFRSPKKHVGGGYISRGQVKYFSEISCLTPPKKNPGLKGGGYYNACTKHFPVLLCTTKLAQSISQYFFVLQSLHKLLPSTSVYYKACNSWFLLVFF